VLSVTAIMLIESLVLLDCIECAQTAKPSAALSQRLCVRPPYVPPDTLGRRTDSEGSFFTDARSDVASVLRFKGIFTTTKCRISDLPSAPILLRFAFHRWRFRIFPDEPAIAGSGPWRACLVQSHCEVITPDQK
jgi:hypothetical protein